MVRCGWCCCVVLGVSFGRFLVESLVEFLVELLLEFLVEFLVEFF